MLVSQGVLLDLACMLGARVTRVRSAPFRNLFLTAFFCQHSSGIPTYHEFLRKHSQLVVGLWEVSHGVLTALLEENSSFGMLGPRESVPSLPLLLYQMISRVSPTSSTPA